MALYVNRMITDKWAGVFCDEDEILMPSSEDLSEAIEALDAKTKTLVSLFSWDGTQLIIGGGAGQYIVCASTPNEQFWNLIADGVDNQAGVVLLNAGGQEGDYPARQVIGKSQVLQAVQAFFKTGGLDLSLSWEKQN